uniref:Alcohol acetyltransferase n=1 Tax=Kwoniella pini CBS 10737 TaxID=1296096 RepID=A0A1B9HTT9_9TREE|nr:uncharacterized protein I206_07543 [Kwoniella pini CBS 10737]OCF46688.1 hypothetical protein I206_07543 [Kwoniella pini CBS 10737]
MSMPLTPPYTPLTDSSTPVLTKEKLPSNPKVHYASTALLTPPQTPELEFESVQNDLSEKLQIQDQGRKLSDNEISYYLPSRADGVNDMYVHHKLLASPTQLSPSRILHIWAYQLLLHPLLASTTKFHSYDNIHFVPTRPTSLIEALVMAAERFSYLTDERDIIDTYLNGPRTLSDERLGYLVVKAPSTKEIKQINETVEYEIMLCSTHYLGDGMALHSFMNEFYILLGSDSSIESIIDLIEEKLNLNQQVKIPKSLEERLPIIGNGSKLANIIGKDELNRLEKKLIGGQSFGTNKDKLPRQTIVPTISYDKDKTKMILGNCKKNGVTIAHAVFALCNIAWSRKTIDKFDPCLIYSALNLRPNMLPSTSENFESFFHLAVGYFNIVLPTLIPSTITLSELFWHRAKMTKNQTIKAVKSPFVVSRSRNTSIIRKERAIKWAIIDDKQIEENSNIGLEIIKKNPPQTLQLPTPENTPIIPEERKISQKALMGLSMLGNLDGMYKHSSFPSLQLTSLTTGSRQRNGALLLFAYTFAGKLWFSLGYDKNGFPSGVIEGFWQECQDLIDEVLL